jgi:hypothetical protein
VEAIGILVGVDRRQQRTLRQSRWQWKLQQDAIDGRIGVEPFDAGLHLGSCRGGGQMGPEVADADPAAGLLLVGHVHPAGGIVADPEHRQPRGPARRRQSGGHHRLQPLLDLGRQTTSVEESGHHTHALGASMTRPGDCASPPRPRRRAPLTNLTPWHKG